MTHIQEVHVQPVPLRHLGPFVSEEQLHRAEERMRFIRVLLGTRAIWNVNSTPAGGGVAEMLRPLISYARGEGIDCRWAVISGDPEFFKLTKRIHHALHGSAGDGSPIDGSQRAIFERTAHDNAQELGSMLREGDIAVLHDPQTAGMAPHLLKRGVSVIWRCHIGPDKANEHVDAAWEFLRPYLEPIPRFVFSRSSYVPEMCDHGKATIIQPGIDPYAPKNQELSEAAVRGILVHTGIVEGPALPDSSLAFRRSDGSPGRVEHRADLVRMGRPPSWDAPLVVQVSRWDPLKDPVGVMRGFASLVNGDSAGGAHLVLAGPNVHSVADDPEADGVFYDVLRAWRALPHVVRNHVTLASLPTMDIDENAAIVNAIQRHAQVIVQKSLQEGFGLTVTEGMWKGRAVLASAVGGIQDQIEDGVSGVLIKDPRDIDEFATALRGLLEKPSEAARIGEAAREHVRSKFLGVRQLLDYAELIEKVDG